MGDLRDLNNLVIDDPNRLAILNNLKNSFVNTTPTSANYQISAEPSPGVLKSGFYDPGKVILGKLIEFAKNYSSDPSNYFTPMEGVVLNPKNAAALKSTLLGIIKENPNITDQELAFKFAQLKYPKLGNLHEASIKEPEFNFENMLDMLAGRRVYGESDPVAKKITLFRYPDRAPEDIASDLMHEQTHAWQAVRDPVGLNTTYVRPEYPGVGQEKYQDQSWEVLARKGGNTAKNAITKFKELISGKPKLLDVSKVADEELLKGYVEPFLTARAKEILDSRMPPDLKEVVLRGFKSNFDIIKQNIATPRTYYPMTYEDVFRQEYLSDVRDALMKDFLLKRGYTGFEKFADYNKDLFPEDVRGLKDLISK